MNKEKKHRGRYVAAGIIIAMLLGGLGYGFGSGFFGVSGAGGTGPENSQEATTQTAAPEPTKDLKYNITVSESNIAYQGQPISLDALRERLLEDYSVTEVYELRDDHALKSVYDSVTSLLEDIDIPYMEK